ncbi:hypothetical protein ABT336_23175 [Micromonospora sp. NPDC000207]|uniref:hypothetical protein n=1 Tax=Micromonospora sp. NPDC000207 TaxID=3154246 RepID=UPI00331F9A39
MSLMAQGASVFVLDTMALSHFTLADRLDVLQDLLLDAVVCVPGEIVRWLPPAICRLNLDHY